MTIKIYVSGLSGNYEVKKRQQRIQTVLDSCAIAYELIDITEAGCEEERKFMQETAKAKEGDRNPLPPQIFNNKDYCGDYDGFDFANETDQLHQFLKLSEGEVNTAQDILSANRRSSSKERSTAENGIDGVPKEETDGKEEASFWDEKKEEDDSPGFWDEKKEDDGAAKEEKADDSPSFWDQKEGSTEKEAKKEEDDSPSFWDQKEESPVKEVKKEEDESPGFWDEKDGDENEKKEEEDAKEVKSAEVAESQPTDDAEKEDESEEEEDDNDESPDIAELKDVAQRLVGSGDNEQENADKEE